MRRAADMDIFIDVDEFPIAATAVRHIYRRPNVEIEDHGTYKRLILCCPMCGQFLSSYKAGPKWCENGLWQAELHNCPCGQHIDYRGIPHAVV